MLRDIAGSLFMDGNRNCAESVLLAANEHYKLGLKPGDERLIAGFGAGMGCGKVCGALAGCIAVLGYTRITTCAHETDGFKQSCAEFTEEFVHRFGDINCETLKCRYTKPGQRCQELVKSVCDLLEDFLKREL
ncbi:MAG: C-GCAxxG-C-C family (seleno)protein [Eubacteriales bacterium]|jgi:C_GCAxxG_C_C family probable redox protein